MPLAAALMPVGVKPPAIAASVCPTGPAPLSAAICWAAPPVAPARICVPGASANCAPISPRVDIAGAPTCNNLPRPIPAPPPAAAPAAVCITRSAAVRASGTPICVNRFSIAVVGSVKSVPNSLLTPITIGSPTNCVSAPAAAPAAAPGIAPTPANGAPRAAPMAVPAATGARPRTPAPARPSMVVSGSTGTGNGGKPAARRSSGSVMSGRSVTVISSLAGGS